MDDYFLLVESLDTDVVAFAPMLASHHPRVIAVGEGNGDLLRVTLLLSEECRLRRNIPVSKQGAKASVGPLASALASVQVDFTSPESANRPETVQNDGTTGRDRKGSRNDMGDLNDILIGIPMKDDTNHEPTVQARQHRGGVVSYGPNKSQMHNDVSSMEIGMYILLAGFCFAIGIFVISCVVYASKFRPVTIDANGDASVLDALGNPGVIGHNKHSRESTTNAHDWVWLGRATMDRSINASEMESQRGELFLA